MRDTQQAHPSSNKPKRESTLRDERLQQLLDSCQQEILRQIIGPFGLTAAMFDDKDGGNVTTQHNAKQGIFAKESEEFDRSDYDYAVAKRKKMRESVQDGSMNSEEFVDSYTGKKEPTRRTNAEGKQVMNAELDHTIPVKDIHGQGGWMKDKAGRTKLSSTEENLSFTTHQTNRAKSDKAPEEALNEAQGFDKARIDPIVEKAKEAIAQELPTTSERLQYHGKELATEGTKDAGRNAMRQALGILLHEFVNGSFIEIKALLTDRIGQENLIDRLVQSLKRVMDRVLAKLKAALDAALEGGIQGFVSNLLTFLINNLITTSKKLVTIIRDSIQGLWRAIKLVFNPPEGVSALEITREVTKILAAIVTTGLGMLLEESVKGFIVSIAVLAPIADVLATALTAIMTGITGSLIVYAIDRLFDWLNSKGTELLLAQEAQLEAQAEVLHRLQTWLSVQFETSRLYGVCAAEYQQIEKSYSRISFNMEAAACNAGLSIQSRNSIAETIETQLNRRKLLEEALKYL
jgi:AcrR family transcriptional regulator